MSRDERHNWAKRMRKLDELFDYHWPRALCGNTDSADICLRVLDLRARGMGL